MQQEKHHITPNVLHINGGYFEETCLSFFKTFPPELNVCSYLVLMPSVRNRDVSSDDNERKDIQFRGYV